MPRKCTPAVEQAWVSTPERVTKPTHSVNKSLLQRVFLEIDNELILPLEVAIEAFEQLEAVCRAISDLAEQPPANPIIALQRIRPLAALGMDLAMERANLVDRGRERFQDFAAPHRNMEEAEA